jgi:hypothetical protein
MQNVAAPLEDSLEISYRTKQILTIWPSNHTPWYYSKELKTYIHIKPTSWTFTWTLFIIAKTWKKARCPLVDGRINCGTSRHWNIIQHLEEMSNQAMNRYEGKVNAIAKW